MYTRTSETRLKVLKYPAADFTRISLNHRNSRQSVLARDQFFLAESYTHHSPLTTHHSPHYPRVTLSLSSRSRDEVLVLRASNGLQGTRSTGSRARLIFTDSIHELHFQALQSDAKRSPRHAVQEHVDGEMQVVEQREDAHQHHEVGRRRQVGRHQQTQRHQRPQRMPRHVAEQECGRHQQQHSRGAHLSAARRRPLPVHGTQFRRYGRLTRGVLVVYVGPTSG